MKAVTVTSSDTPTSLFELVDGPEYRCDQVILQSDESNIVDIYFGDNGSQTVYLIPGMTIAMLCKDLRALFVKGIGLLNVVII